MTTTPLTELLQTLDEANTKALQDLHDAAMKAALASGEPLIFELTKAIVMASSYADLAHRTIREHLTTHLLSNGSLASVLSDEDQFCFALADLVNARLISPSTGLLKCISCIGAGLKPSRTEGIASAIKSIVEFMTKEVKGDKNEN